MSKFLKSILNFLKMPIREKSVLEARMYGKPAAGIVTGKSVLAERKYGTRKTE